MHKNIKAKKSFAKALILYKKVLSDTKKAPEKLFILIDALKKECSKS